MNFTYRLKPRVFIFRHVISYETVGHDLLTHVIVKRPILKQLLR